MKTANTNRIAEALARRGAMFVGLYYLLTILIGAFLLFFHGRSAFVSDLIASGCYLCATVVFYDLSKSVNTSFSGRK